jgi:thiol-disulfide isomerase/thioredoxin
MIGKTGGHCKSLAPEYEKLAKEMNGIIKVAAVNCDEDKELAGYFGVKGIDGPSIPSSSRQDSLPSRSSLLPAFLPRTVKDLRRTLKTITVKELRQESPIPHSANLLLL